MMDMGDLKGAEAGRMVEAEQGRRVTTAVSRLSKIMEISNKQWH
jgi:hypothetical protein